MTLRRATWPKSSFWTYSLEIYGRPGVEKACLSLQERRGLDVNLLLFAFWLSTRGIVLDRAAAAAAAAAVRDVRERVVQPLRAVRRHLRAISKASSSIARDWPDEVRHLADQVAKAELDGEHVAQLVLERLSAELDSGHRPGAALAAANLAAITVVEQLDVELADRADIRRLFEQAHPGLRPAALADALRTIGLA